MSDGSGCLLISSHFGPSAACVEFFKTCGIPFRTVGMPGADQISPDASTLIGLTYDPYIPLRQMVRLLKQGVMLGVVCDGAVDAEDAEFDFLGRTIRLSTFAPRLAHRLRLPSFWCAPMWRDDRITIEIDRMPSPEPGEALSTWTHRWFADFLTRLESQMRGDPKNLDLDEGVWRNLSKHRIGRARAEFDPGL
jgi:lauroyl/myristoyl acyltransferase